MHKNEYSKTPFRKGTLNAREWEEVLGLVAQHLQHKTHLTIIGSTVGILNGHQSRTTIDIDVWAEKSQFAINDLKQACYKAGVLFNPKGETEDIPYIQLVSSGIVQVGEYDKGAPLAVYCSDLHPDNLTLERPPIENLIASKLLRASPKDLEDIKFLIGSFDPDPKKVHAAIETFPQPQRSIAEENEIYLEVLRRDIGPER